MNFMKNNPLHKSFTQNTPIQSTPIFWEAAITPLRLEYVSQSALTLLPQLASKNPTDFWECIHPEDLQFVQQCYGRATQKGGVQTIQYRVCPVNQPPIWVKDVFELRPAQGTSPRLFGLINQEKQHNGAHETLKKREQAIKDIVNHSAHKKGQAYFNQIAQSLCQVIEADFVVIGKNISQDQKIQTITISTTSQPIPNFCYALRGTPCANVTGQSTCVYPQNVAKLFPEDKMLTEMNIEGYLGTPIFDSDGKSLGIIIALYKQAIDDASYISSLFELFATRIGAEMNRIQSEAKLRESEQRFRQYFKEDKAIKLLIHPDTSKIVDANQAAETFYGYSYEELVQLKISDLNLLDQKGIIKSLQQAKHQQKNKFQFKHLTKAGLVKHVEAYSNPLHIDNTNYLLATVHDITENVQNKLELIKEKQFVDSIIQYAAEGISVFHQTNQYPYVKFTVWNQQMEKITGYTLKEINALGWYQTILPDDTPTHISGSVRMEQLMKGNNLSNEPWIIKQKGGAQRVISISTNIINKADGAHIMAIMQDISEQKQAQKSLMDRQAHMQLLYQITSNASEEINLQLQNALKLTTTFFNAETGMVSSINQENFIVINSYSTQDEMQVGTVIPVADTLCKVTMDKDDVLMIANTQDKKWAAIKPKNTQVLSYIGTVIHVFGKKYGSLCITSTQAHTGYPSVAGEFINLLARWIGNLIEKQIKEKDLRESEERYRSLTESAPIGIVLHAKGKIIYANPFSKQTLEASHQEQLLNLPIQNILHPDSLQVASERIKELYAKKGNYVPPIEEKIVTLKNNIKYCLISGISIEYKGQPAICNVFADISDRKKVEKELLRKKNQLEKVNKELEELTYVASHDLKAPLANLQGLMMLIEEAQGVKEDNLDVFERMQLSVVRMQNTLNNLNEVIALKQEMAIQKESIRFETLFTNVKASLETQIMEAKASITADFSAAPSVEYPLLHLKSIMQNLLTNAIKYRDAHRPLSIRIRTTMHNGQACLMVKDNGLGIDLSKSKDKLFGLFKRLHVHVEGKGIGLYILKSIVESHRGFIEVTSKLNQGTTFKIYLGNE